MYKRIVALGGVAALGLGLGVAAHAAQEEGVYAGIGLGKATVEDDGFNFDDDATGFKVFGGYLLNRYFGAEITYFDAGETSQGISPGIVGINGLVLDVEVTGFNFSALGRLPVNENFALFGKFGVATYNIDGTFRIGNTTLASADDDEDDISYGVGAAFRLGAFEVRGEYEAIDVDGGDFNLLMVSGAYRF